MVFPGPEQIAKPWLTSCPHPLIESTGTKAGALTVAGQWRNFTAFPSILAIAVVDGADLRLRQPERHGTDFHVFNFYRRGGLRSQKATEGPCTPCEMRREPGEEKVKEW